MEKWQQERETGTLVIQQHYALIQKTSTQVVTTIEKMAAASSRPGNVPKVSKVVPWVEK